MAFLSSSFFVLIYFFLLLVTFLVELLYVVLPNGCISFISCSNNLFLVVSLSPRTGILGYMMEYLLDCYRGDTMFSFNKKVGKFRFMDVALITSSRLVSPGFVPTAIEDATFR